MDPQIARYFASNGFNPDSLGGAAPVDRGMLAQAVMAQQGMPPPQQGPMMGGAPPRGGYALGTFQGGPDPNAPGRMAGQSYPGLYNSSEDRGSYDPAGDTGDPAGFTGNAIADTITGNYGGFANPTPGGFISGPAVHGNTSFQSGPPTGSFAPSNPLANHPTPSTTFNDRWGGLPSGSPIDNNDIIASIMGAVNAPVPSGAPPGGAPPSGRGAPLGTFETGPDPNAPGSTAGTPGGFGGVADPGGYGGFGAFGGFSPGMAGQGGWGGGFEGSGFNSSADYSGGYDTAAGAPG